MFLIVQSSSAIEVGQIFFWAFLADQKFSLASISLQAPISLDQPFSWASSASKSSAPLRAGGGGCLSVYFFFRERRL